MTVTLGESSLTARDVVEVARHAKTVDLSPHAVERMRSARRVLEDTLERGDAIYGLTTGVGPQKRVGVTADDVEHFNRLMILNTRVGQGQFASDDVVRAAMLVLASGFSTGRAGVRPELAHELVRALNERVHPDVRTLGSVGQADLAPMADLAYGLTKELEINVAAGEALALLSNNAFATGSAALSVNDSGRLLDAVDAAAALDFEGFACDVEIVDEQVAEGRPPGGVRDSIARLRALLQGSYLWSETSARNVHDPLSFRCVPFVHGAARDVFDYAVQQVEAEVNAHQGSPVVVVDAQRMMSIPNFEPLALSLALDCLRIALASVLTIANERLVKMLQAPLSGLPEGLAARFGLAEAGLAEFAVSGQAITAEARLLAQPVSLELASSTHGEGVEDRTTMAPLAARRLAQMVDLGERVIAIELVVAAQAVEVRNVRTLGAGTRKIFDLVRDRVAFTSVGNAIPQDLEPVVTLVRSGVLSSLAEPRRRGDVAGES